MTTETKEREITRKYVVIRNRVSGNYMVGDTLKDRYHIDVFGERVDEHVGEDWYPHSAGLYTWVYDKPETITTHGKSEGFHIKPLPIDVKLLSKYLDRNSRAIEFDSEGNPFE